jgi:hypothetical protein
VGTERLAEGEEGDSTRLFPGEQGGEAALGSEEVELCTGHLEKRRESHFHRHSQEECHGGWRKVDLATEYAAEGVDSAVVRQGCGCAESRASPAAIARAAETTCTAGLQCQSGCKEAV